MTPRLFPPPQPHHPRPPRSSFECVGVHTAGLIFPSTKVNLWNKILNSTMSRANKPSVTINRPRALRAKEKGIPPPPPPSSATTTSTHTTHHHHTHTHTQAALWAYHHPATPATILLLLLFLPHAPRPTTHHRLNHKS